MDFIYSNIFIPLAKCAVNLLKHFIPKIKQREKKCKELMEKYENEPIQTIGKRYWFHAASMGEFEQAKPIIEKLKSTNPDCFVFVTFYSPSGYENQKNYSFADSIAYMPIDSKKNAKQMIEIIKPHIAVFIRYDIWLNHLLELKKLKIPMYLVNASKPRSQKLNFFYTKAYRLFDKIYVMTESEAKYFVDVIRHKFVRVLPDTRFDRIWQKVETNKANPLFDQNIFGTNKVLVAGSTWEPDEELLFSSLAKINQISETKISMIIVPHEPSDDRIAKLKNKYNNLVLLSEFDKNPNLFIEALKSGKSTIIVDSIGKLLRIYANANIAYVGGAFGVGIHSVTEPAGYGLPIICGQKMHNSPDAVELEKIGVLKTIKNSDELFHSLMQLLDDTDYYQSISNLSSAYVQSRIGATDIIFNEIK